MYPKEDIHYDYEQKTKIQDWDRGQIVCQGYQDRKGSERLQRPVAQDDGGSRPGRENGAEISPALVSQVTKAVLKTIQSWQNRPFDSVYSIVYLDGIVVKVRQDKRVVNKTICVALRVDLEGRKDCLGLWIHETELIELRERGLKDVLVVCADGLTGLPDAIETVY